MQPVAIIATDGLGRPGRQRRHLFQGRYRAIPVAKDAPEYFQVVSTYIHLNPARAKLIRVGEQKLWEYAWRSYAPTPRRRGAGLVSAWGWATPRG